MRRDLLASFFTLAGEVDPFARSTVSPAPLRERIEAAGRAGFTGFGFGADDLRSSLKTWSFADIARMLEDNGLAVVELEPLRGWFDDGFDIDGPGPGFVFEAAERLGVRHVKAGGSGPERPRVEIADRLRALGERTALAGTCVVVELSPIGRIATLDCGQALIALTDHPDVGLLLDIWHVVRSGMPMEAIARTPLGVVRYVELCDGALAAGPSYVEDTVNRRRPCGGGDFPIAAFLQAIAACGYDGPLGVEVLSEAQRALSPERAAAAVFPGAAAALASWSDASQSSTVESVTR